MNKDIYFMPLGGGQSVGASCYYLRLGESNIILDAGTGKKKGLEFEPDFYPLLTSSFMQSANQINQVFISHAHMDHIGYLLKLMAQAKCANVYMTEMTKVLAEFQLYDRIYINKEKDEYARLAAKSLMEKIITVSYMQKIDCGNYKATFFNAGHIPGAMMVLMEMGKKKILYTGDYSIESTVLTSKCMIPHNMEIDVLIMCGLHAKNSDYTNKSDSLQKKAYSVLKTIIQYEQPALCHVSQLSKGIEFLKCINNLNDFGIPIYVDESVMNVVSKMEKLHIPILNEYNKIMTDEVILKPHIYLTSNKNKYRYRNYNEINIDFSLHEDFLGMKEFIKTINPKSAVVVHCAKEGESRYNTTIEQEIMLDGECRTQFIFAEENEIYKL